MGDFKTIATNRRAYYEYTITETLEAGIVLTGSEIKSIRAGKVNLKDAYAHAENGELWLVGMHIARYDAASRDNPDPVRARKLLLHRDEISYLGGLLTRRGLTVVPLKLYIKHGVAKVELGLARGKKLYDKREAKAREEEQREISRVLKHFNR